jgi:hypothetical protein
MRVSDLRTGSIIAHGLERLNTMLGLRVASALGLRFSAGAGVGRAGWTRQVREGASVGTSPEKVWLPSLDDVRTFYAEVRSRLQVHLPQQRLIGRVRSQGIVARRNLE